MYIKQATIVNEEGMHMRPAQLLTEKASKFTSHITLTTDENDVIDVKSILGLMSLGLAKGSVVTLKAEGEDEQQAVDALAEFFAEGFGEYNVLD
jgi:phosphocarrier protein HPr